MRVKIIFLLMLYLILVFSLKESEAKTFAYLIGEDGTVSKIDTDTDTVVSESKLEKSSYVQSGETSVVVDKVNNNLYVVTGRLTPYYIYVYDLKTLKFKKGLGVRPGKPPILNPDVNILVSPNGNQLFINWYDAKEGGWFFDLYDAKTLTEIRNLGDFTWGPKTTFSSNGSKIYVYNGQNDTIQIHETVNFTLLETIDLKTIWKTGGFGSWIEDYKDEKILIQETKTVAQDATPEITYFIYNLKDKTLSPRISTEVAGNTKLSLDGTKIFISDEDSVWSSDKTYVKYQKSTGNLYIYNVATGTKIGTVLFSVDKSSEIVGIHPNGSKVYMIGTIAGERSLIVLDVVKFKIANTIKISSGMFLIFYDE